MPLHDASYVCQADARALEVVGAVHVRFGARSRVLHCIGEQVGQNLMQQRAVAADVGQLFEPPLDLAIPDLGLQLGDDFFTSAFRSIGALLMCVRPMRENASRSSIS